MLQQENPSLTGTVSRMTTLLRQEDAYLDTLAENLLTNAAREDGWSCEVLRQADPVLRRRALRRLLQIPKPSMHHVERLEALVHGTDGTVSVPLSGKIGAVRSYDLLRILPREQLPAPPAVALHPGDDLVLPEWGLRVQVQGPVILEKQVDCLSTFALRYDMINHTDPIWLRSRQPADHLRLPGGSRSLKRLMIDRKIPADQRHRIPVLADTQGVLAVYNLGADRERSAHLGEKALLVKIIVEERERT